VLAASLVGLAAVAGMLYFRVHQASHTAGGPPAGAGAGQAGWIDRLHSQNPREVEAASRRVTALGPAALPVIQAILRDPESDAERLKGALKACGILGKTAAPAIPEVAAVLPEPGLTAEAAIALSYMGAKAFDPLRDALSSKDPLVRREALRSIGKLEERGPLDVGIVFPVLTERIADPDPGVRAVAATYLGIIHQNAREAVPALIAALGDPDPEVRRAAAAALPSFGADAAPALPSLRKAAGDRNEDVAREAGRAIINLRSK
jgi:HEAT repeat protein